MISWASFLGTVMAPRCRAPALAHRVQPPFRSNLARPVPSPFTMVRTEPVAEANGDVVEVA